MNAIIVIILSLTLTISTSFSDEIDFTETYNLNMYGDIRLIGNTVLEIDSSKNRTDNNYFLSDDDAAYGLKINSGLVANIWGGSSWIDVSSYEANNFTYMRYINVNNNGDTNIFNSSSSTLTLPTGSKIIFARLYWSGMIHNYNNGYSLYTKKLNSKKIKLKIDNVDIGNGNDAFIDITVDKTNEYDTTEGWAEIEYTNYNLAFSRYSAYKDITDNLKDIDFYGNSINVTAANIMSEEGWLRNYGNYGAWSLVVVYENYADIYRNVSLHTGYKVVYNTDDASIEIPISGFITPTDSAVSSTLSVFATEGEKTTLFGQDYLKVANKDDTNRISASFNSAYPNQSTNIFDSTITNNETKVPSVSNTMGIDIDSFEIGVDGETTHPQIIENLQTNTVIELSSGGDAYTVNTVALSTELYVPEFCYDYAYKQQGTYFTEDNTGSQLPRLTGNVVTGEDVNVTIFIKSLVKDIPIIGMDAHINDINSTQVTYINESTYLAKIGDLIPKHIPDSTLDIGTSNPEYVNNIHIGDINTDEYFYIYYSLNPQTTSLDMPLNVDVTYQLVLNGQTVDYTSRLGVDMPMCPSSGLTYTPSSGMFNVVHNDYYNYDTGGANRYYNLPTQVSSREGNFKVLSLDTVDNDLLKINPTIVAVELIDAGAFHYTDASCSEQSSSISPRVWVIFDDNATSIPFNQATLQTAIATGMTELANSAQFFSISKQNAAFRISYNAMDDNDTSVYLEKENNGKYTMLNWRTAWNGEECVQDMDNNPSSTDTVASYCIGTGNNPSTIAQCMECVYGKDTRVVCSRDNFALRPEALLIKLNDQNQTNPTQIQRLDDDGLGIISGVTAPTQRVLNLASGYTYNLEVNATNHLNNVSTVGYTKSIYEDEPKDFSGNKWEPRSAVFGCNDTNDTHNDIRFVNGYANANLIVNQVGDYRFTISDTTWTTVDNDPNYMQHHVSPYFLSPNIKDCVENTSLTYPVNTSLGLLSPVNGCDINSTHNSSGSSMQYRDYNITYHPYKFDMTGITPSLALNNGPLGPNSFLYMADITQPLDENMSLHLNGNIVAQGFNNTQLTNFITGCYAKGVDLNISKSNTDLNNTSGNPVILQSVFHNRTVNNTIVAIQDVDTNDTDPSQDLSIPLTATYFRTDLNGSMNTILNINYDRDKNATVNPKRIEYFDYKVNCTNENVNCQFKADLVNDKTTEGVLPIDTNITHYYARTNAPRQRFIAPAGNTAPAIDFIYYELYCDNPLMCKALLPNGLASNTTNDPRWFVNTLHTNNYGRAEQRATGITQKYVNPDKVSGTMPTGNHQDFTDLRYNETKYPYKATMENNASGWLIYNKYNIDAEFNEFEVEFDGGTSNWAGKHETDVTTKANGAYKTNRRSMW